MSSGYFVMFYSRWLMYVHRYYVLATFLGTMEDGQRLTYTSWGLLE